MPDAIRAAAVTSALHTLPVLGTDLRGVPAPPGRTTPEDRTDDVALCEGVRFHDGHGPTPAGFTSLRHVSRAQRSITN